MADIQYTVRAQQALATAHELASSRSNPELTPDHLLLALTADQDAC